MRRCRCGFALIVLFAKAGERGAQEACAGEGRWGWCLLRAPRDLFCDRRRLSGVATEPRVAIRLGDKPSLLRSFGYASKPELRDNVGKDRLSLFA